MQLETLERRELLAGLDLISVSPNGGLPLEDGERRDVAPRELRFEFTRSVGIDDTTLDEGIVLTRSGRDGVFGDANDVRITPGYLALDEDEPNVVLMRFASTLPDDEYQLEVLGSGATPLLDTVGDPFNGGNDRQLQFTLDLGAQVVAFVPQPVLRDQVITIADPVLVQAGDQVVIDDGTSALIFEFDDGSGITGDVSVPFNAGDSATMVAGNLAAAITGAPFPGSGVTAVPSGAGVTLTGDAFSPVVSLQTTDAAAIAVTDGALSQRTDLAIVYFNQDELGAAAESPTYYRLLNAAGDSVALPVAVSYDAARHRAVLDFGGALPVGTHRLQIGATDEPNNVLATAVSVGTLLNGAPYVASSYLGDDTGASDHADDVDLYRILLPEMGTITASVTPQAGHDTLLRLFDQAGAELAVNDSGAAGATDTLSSMGTLLPGTYYVGVSSSGNAGYSAVDGTGSAGGSTTGSYQVNVSVDAMLSLGDDNSSFATATSLGVLGAAEQAVAAQIEPQPIALPQYPGGEDEPGHRDIPAEAHLGSRGVSPVLPDRITVFPYYFGDFYGVDPQGNPLYNAITENQKERAREIFEIFSSVAGIQFVETANSGLQVVTGDTRAIAPTFPPNALGGIAGGGKVVMNNNLDYGASEFGGTWFGIAMHEIGHAVGLGHAYDIPSVMGAGAEDAAGASPADIVYPTDHDIVHLQRIHRPDATDIDLYEFELEEPGYLAAEIVAERLSSTSLLNAALTLFDADGEVISRNDDYYGNDPFVGLNLEAGTYYLGVTSTGNLDYDPHSSDTGFGGRTDGVYDLRLRFEPDATPQLTDATGTLFDGDADGKPGGVYEFAFEAGPTLFVDKITGSDSNDGSLTSPFETIAKAFHQVVALVADIVRIVGNGDVTNAPDEVEPYLIGLDSNFQELADGRTFEVPQGTTVMIDAGVVVKLEGAIIDVGSSAQGVDRSHGALQVLGTPDQQVYFTSWGNDAIGGDTDGAGDGANRGDWGGIVFRSDSDFNNTPAPPAALPRIADLVSSSTFVASWQDQGPGPTNSGQVENVAPNNEVVGAVHTVVAHPTDPDVLWIGGANGGIWRTNNATDARPNWIPLIDDLPSLSIGALELDPTDPTHQTLLAGIGRFSSFGQAGGPLTGLLLSTDGGDNWTQINPALLQGRNFSGVAKRGNLLLAAANNFGGGSGAGVYRSTDGGANWSFISGSNGLSFGAALDLVGDPAQPNRFYASVQGVGIFRSDDGGANWVDISQNDPGGVQAAIQSGGNNNTEMAVSPVNGRLFVAVLRNGQPNYIGYADGLGATWTEMDLPTTPESNGDIEGLNPREKPGGQGAIHFSIVADPADPNTFYVGGDRQDSPFPNFLEARNFSGRLFRGDTTAPRGTGSPSPQWEHLTHSRFIGEIPEGGTLNNSSPHADSREMVFDAAGNLIEVDDGGIYRRTDPRTNQGDWFSIIGNLQTTEFHNIAYDTNTNTLVGGAQDTGTPMQLFPNNPLWDSISTADGGDVAIDTTTIPGQSIRYTSFQNLGAFRRGTYDGNNTRVDVAFPTLTPINGSPPLTPLFVTPLELNVSDQTRLLIGGGNGVFESFDQGDTITMIGPGVSQNAMVYGNATNPDVVYYGSGSTIFVRAVLGSPAMPTPTSFPGGFVRDVVLDPNDWMTAIVIDRDKVFQSTDAGASWVNITGDLVTHGLSNLRTVEYVPGATDGIIVIGTEAGVFSALVSAPTMWSPLGDSLANAPVWDLDYDPVDDVLVAGTLGRGAWKLSVPRAPEPLARSGVFLNSVNNAELTFGGGRVFVDSVEERFTPIHVEGTRPTISFNTITTSADAAISADPNSFDDSLGRSGPDIHGNQILNNSINGVFVRIRTDFGKPIDTLDATAHFDDTDIVHVIAENLEISGNPGGPFGSVARSSGRLHVDPGVIIKLDNSRIEASRGPSQLIAEGTDGDPIIFTSLKDDRHGAGGTFDTSNDGTATVPQPGDWAGLVFNPVSSGSLDHTIVAYGGGQTPIAGGFDQFNPVEIDRATVRVANSRFENNADGLSTSSRNGRGANDAATIFVRTAQPIIVANTFLNNGGNAISIDANSLNKERLVDPGNRVGLALPFDEFSDNQGPLIGLNTLINNDTNGMHVRGAELTTETVWDDTDIVHVLRSEILQLNHHTYSGLRLKSAHDASLVVKLEGNDAGFTVDGTPLDIDDRIGGTIQVIGRPGFPVVLTSLADDTVGAGILPNGLPQNDTNNDGPSTGSPGDWRSIRLDRFSNDRNVRVVLEQEPLNTNGDNANGNPRDAQFMGELAPNEKSGDDNRPLGFEIHGAIARDDSADTDVYSFSAQGQTEVWLDIDRTSSTLDAVLELIDATGLVLASSTDNFNRTGLAQDITEVPAFGGDYYTLNFRDPSMRVVLPGPASRLGTYFVRVRSLGGDSSGSYQLQARLRQIDEKPGSTVRYADIRYADTAVEVFGLPGHSPLLAEQAEARDASNGAFGPNSAEFTGNLLAIDRNTISVSGSLSATNGSDLDWYRFEVDYQAIQSIGGVNDGGKTWSTVFDIDYADGLARPDTTLAVFDAQGNLILIGRESNVIDDQPAPGQGVDLDDLSRGTVGRLDPFIGPVQLAEGTSRSYYVAISSNRYLPAILDGTFRANATDLDTRLEPINGVQRIAEDHIGFQGYTSGDPDIGTVPVPPSYELFDITDEISLSTHVVPFNLSNVALFVTGGFGLVTVDALNGGQVTNVGSFTNIGTEPVEDLAMRTDGNLFGYQRVNNTANTAGRLVGLDPATVAVDPPQTRGSVIGNDSIPNAVAFPLGPGNPTDEVDALAYDRVAYDFDNSRPVYELYYSVPRTGIDASGFPVEYSLLYQANPNTGSMTPPSPNPTGIGLKGAIQPSGVSFAQDTVTFNDGNGNVSTVTLRAIAPGPAGNGFTVTINRADAANSINVFGNAITINLDTNPNATAQNFIDLINNNGAANQRMVAAVTSGAAGTAGATVTPFASLAGGAGTPINGVVTGLAFVEGNFGSTLLGVTDEGEFLEIDTGNANVNFQRDLNAESGITNFQGATPGPTNLEGGRFSSMVFAITGDGLLYALDSTTGEPQPAFGDDPGGAGSGGAFLEVEPNNTLVTAQDLESLPFNRGFSTDIGDALGNNTSTTIPHVSIQGTGDNTVDVYRFDVTTANSRGIFDIDGGDGLGIGDFDSNLNLYDSVGTLLASNDLSIPTDPGSVSFFDALIDYTFTATGTYYIEVGTFPGGNPIPTGATYTLHVSLENHATIGQIAYVSNGPNSADFNATNHASWLDTSPGGAGAYNAAIRNFAWNAAEGGAGNVLFVSDTITDSVAIPNVLQGDGHTVTVVTNDFSLGNNPTLLGTLSSFDAVVWSATGSGSGSVHTNPAVFANLTSYVMAGGDVFVTGYDSIASPSDAQLVAFLGGTSSGDTPGTTGAVVNVSNSLTTGLVDIRGVVPTGGHSDRDQLEGLAADTVTVVSSSTFGNAGAQWTLRTPGVSSGGVSIVPGVHVIDTGVFRATGLAFSPLDFNLWHPTMNRRGDVGHGINSAFDNSRNPANTEIGINGRDSTENEGGASFYFGLEEFDEDFTDDVYFRYESGGQLGILNTNTHRDLASNNSIGGNYNLPGGALGSLVTNPFSLVNYTLGDRPVLYFNYLLQTEGAASNDDDLMRDSARVSVSADGGQTWELVATNNSTLDEELPEFISHLSTAAGSGNTLTQQVQELFDTRNWRQARVDLGRYAGQGDLRLRFDFSTAGDMNQNLPGDAFGDFEDSERGQRNNFEGFYVDDIIIGFAERGEMVTRDTPSPATAYFQVDQNPDGSQEQLQGPYQFEIRRGTEFGVSAADDATPIVIAGTFDTNDRLVRELNVLGDDNFHREQGHVAIEQNSIRDVDTFGILVDAGARDAGTNAPHPGSVINTPTLNNFVNGFGMAPGVSVINNVVSGLGSAIDGIRISGQTATNSQPLPAVLLSKVINNTVVGSVTRTAGVGIRVEQNGAAVILNNILANTNQGVRIDGPSPQTDVGTNLFHDNLLNGVVGTSVPLFTSSNPLSPLYAPLFVNPLTNNFYLASGSPAIDSSLNKLPEDASYTAVKDDLDIPPSDSFAPRRDLFGQLRVDDPTQDPPPGVGNDVFRDRGAIERADFVGGRAFLLYPEDNGDNPGEDLLGSVDNDVWIDSPIQLTQFIVQLVDAGIGIDDSTINSSQFLLFMNGNLLIEGVDYEFAYNANLDRVILRSSTVFALDSRYTIVLDRDPLTGVKDRAGNLLQANRPDGSVRFEIIVTDGQNDPPINTAPASWTTFEDTALVFSSSTANGVSVSDRDAGLGTGELTVTLTATNGLLTLSQTDGLTFVGGATGTGETNMTFSGLIADLNAALEGVAFLPDPNFNDLLGAAQVTIFTEDLGQFSPDPLDPQDSGLTVIDISVLPVNDSPEFAKGDDQSVLEDAGLQTVLAWATGMEPPYIALDEVNQVLTFVTSVVSVVGNLSFTTLGVNAVTGDLIYETAPNTNGSATISVSLMDDGGTDNGGIDRSAPYTFTITVTPVNDAPEFTPGADEQILEDAGPQQVFGWATDILPGPLTATDELTQTLSFEVIVDVVTGNLAFATLPAIDPVSGTLTYETAPDTNGTATVLVTLVDDGGILNNGIDRSTTHTLTIDVLPVNDAPEFTAGPNPNVLEDANGNGATTLVGWATDIAPGPATADDETGQVRTFDLTVLATTGSLSFTALPQIVDPATGTLTFQTSPHTNGTATVEAVLRDDGGTANGGVDRLTRQFIITVVAVNDAPLFIKGPDIDNLLEDAGPQTFTGWATGMQPGPPEAVDEVGQALTFAATVSNTVGNIAFTTPPQINSTTGTLTFETAPHTNGIATISIVLQDDGGTANGGQNTSPVQTFTITVTAVNDAPQFSPGPNQTVLEDAGLQVVPSWATGIRRGPLAATDEAGQQLNFVVTIIGTTDDLMFSTPPAVDPATGNLTYQSAQDSYGSAALEVVLLDDGGTDNGGVDTSIRRTFFITVLAVNDPPVANDFSITGVFEDGPSVTVPIDADDVDRDDNQQTLRYTLVTRPDEGRVTRIQQGMLTYDPRADFQDLGEGDQRTVTFEYRATDRHGASDTGIISVEVTGVNDAPSAVADFYMTDQFTSLNESAPGLINNDFDVDANDSFSVVQFGTTSGLSGFSAMGAAVTLAADGSFTYDPTVSAMLYAIPRGSSVQDTFTYVIEDEIGARDTGNVTITVEGLNKPPQTMDDQYETDEETVLTRTAVGGLLANDSDLDGDTLLITRFDAESTLGATVVVNPDGSFSYDPTNSPNLQAIREGFSEDDTFTVTVSDGEEFVESIVTVTVYGVNELPVAQDDRIIMQPNTTATIPILDNDSDPDGSLVPGSVRIITPPSYGSVTINLSDGSLSYTPFEDYRGSDIIIYTVADDDGGVSEPTLVDILVNDTPQAIDDSTTVPVNVTSIIRVLDNDIEVDGVLIPGTIIIADPPTNGSVAIHDNNTPADLEDDYLTYTPDTDYEGPDSFQYSVQDDNGIRTNVATVSLTVQFSAFPANNLQWRFDVNHDGRVSPVDPLIIINYLNTSGAGEVPPSYDQMAVPPFMDVIADNFIAPSDVNSIITYLNGNSPGAGAEGESAAVSQPGTSPNSLLIIDDGLRDATELPTDDRQSRKASQVDLPAPELPIRRTRATLGDLVDSMAEDLAERPAEHDFRDLALQAFLAEDEDSDWGL